MQLSAQCGTPTDFIEFPYYQNKVTEAESGFGWKKCNGFAIWSGKIDANEDPFRFRDVYGLGPAFGNHIDMNGDGSAADPHNRSLEPHDIAHEHRFLEFDLVDGKSNE
jgi:hypothetical protein